MKKSAPSEARRNRANWWSGAKVLCTQQIKAKEGRRAKRGATRQIGTSKPRFSVSNKEKPRKVRRAERGAIGQNGGSEPMFCVPNKEKLKKAVGRAAAVPEVAAPKRE